MMYTYMYVLYIHYNIQIYMYMYLLPLPVVPGSNAGVEPDAVVIKSTHTLVTHTAMLGTI